MPRGSTTQTRTFNYSTGNTVGALLLSATNPENGTVTYTYNSDMTLATKTDAKGQQFTYQYDIYKRLTQVSVGGTVLRTYVYDTNADDSNYSQYTAGRLTEIKYPTNTFLTYANGPQATTAFTDMFSYTQPGQIAGKRLRVTKTNPYVDTFGHTVSQTGVGDLNMTYAYNNEGKPTNVTYPTDANNNTPAFNYSYDSMMRLAGATDQNSNAIVSGVQYNVASQLTAINYYGATETHSYNTLLQLTNITTAISGTAGTNLTYNYAAGSDNGKIGSLSDAISGETVSYQYDSLNRLISASGNGWTQTQSYDGFGNLIARAGTGTAQSTTISTPADAATNRLTGYYYDANGNQLSTGYTYDAENRIIQANAGAVLYTYDAQNKRIWQANISNSGPTTETVTLFGADGRLIATYQPQGNWTNSQTQVTLSFSVLAERAYFGGKLVGQATTGALQAAVQDRLGSVGKYYPYGEDRNAAPLPNDQVKFATYTRDSATGLDYADQRYYASAFGRFMTPDPYQSGASSPTDSTRPQSWNRYAYVLSDPVNFADRRGLYAGEPEDDPPPDFCDLFPLECGIGQPQRKPPGTGDDPFPECDHRGNSRNVNTLDANNLQFIVNNYDDAQKIANENNVPVDWILGWAAYESGGYKAPYGTFWGSLPQAQAPDNNFFGEVGKGWAGQIACAVSVTNSEGGTFACFTSFYGSANAAVSSKYGTILVVDAANGVSAAQTFEAIYAAGWNTKNPAKSGDDIQNIISRSKTGIDALIKCLKDNNYI